MGGGGGGVGGGAKRGECNSERQQIHFKYKCMTAR